MTELGGSPVKPKVRAPRGIDKADILKIAFNMMAEEGESGFSVRKLGAKAGIDPMTVLHHFQSRENLLRHIADRALSTIAIPPPSDNWKTDLRGVAHAYRDLAHRYPKMFHLHFRFHATGPADHMTSEVVFRAMLNAGLSDNDAAGLALSFYTFLIGFGLAETEGLMMPLNEDEEKELRELDPVACEATHRLIPTFKTLDSKAAFEATIDAFIVGVERRVEMFTPGNCQPGPRKIKPST
jgi:AcrR family transcriptional regulator